jgi:hypothetical protein
MGYVLIALENGRSVFPVERRFDGPATEINCVHAGSFSFIRRTGSVGFTGLGKKLIRPQSFLITILL